MKLSWTQAVNDKTWITAQVMDVLTGDLIDETRESQEYDIKITINGREFEPTLLVRLFEEQEKFIKTEAQKLVTDKFDDVDRDVELLKDTIREVKYKIQEKFEIRDEDL
jgi:hypothetical protein